MTTFRVQTIVIGNVLYVAREPESTRSTPVPYGNKVTKAIGCRHFQLVCPTLAVESPPYQHLVIFHGTSHQFFFGALPTTESDIVSAGGKLPFKLIRARIQTPFVRSTSE